LPRIAFFSAGTLYGPMLGAAVFTIFEERLSSLIPWWRLLLGTAFVAVVLFVPKGLVSIPSRLAESVERADEATVSGRRPDEVEGDD
jgi:branched-chain amino acid transport system permease protein